GGVAVAAPQPDLLQREGVGQGPDMPAPLHAGTEHGRGPWPRPVQPDRTAGPTPAALLAPGGASSVAARALATEVRRAVRVVPSTIATSRPSSGSRTRTVALTVGRPAAALPGLTLPNLLTAPLPGARRAA